MPVPIKFMPEKSKDYNYKVDYSFLANVIPEPSKDKKVLASNNDASLLFKIWHTSQKNDDDSYSLDSSINSKDVLRLKTQGFLTGTSEKVKFTRRGKLVVTTMALGEPNKFGKEKKEKPYTEILASMDKRGKKGYRIPKFSSNTSNNIRL